METYIKLLQFHARINNITYSNNLIKKEIKIPKPSRNELVDETTIDRQNYTLWTCLFREEDNGELGYEDNCVHFQIYFIINSLTCFYNESIEKQVSRKHLLFIQAVNNIFLTSNIKAQLRNIYEKTQRSYLALIRFANMVRHKLGKEKIDVDLHMEPIDIRSKYAICLYHNGAKYFFKLTDLVNIIENAVTNSNDLVENPLFPKNPYNNMPFTKTNLYNIYYRIKFAFNVIPQWLHLFYISNFDIAVFKVENEQKLRECHIKHYINNASVSTLYDEFQSMIINYRRIFRRIEIDNSFPKKEVVDVFRPYLYLYVMSIDSIDGTEKKRLSSIILKRRLELFVAYNKNFGRKIITTRYENTSTPPPDLTNYNPFSVENQNIHRRLVSHTSFNNKHPCFTLNDAYNSFNINRIFIPLNYHEDHNAIFRRNNLDISFREDNSSTISNEESLESDQSSSREAELFDTNDH
jgi:hypothetical protein